MVPLLSVCGLLLGGTASADRPLSVDPIDAKHELVIDLKIELPIVILSAAILGGSQFVAAKYGPTTCGWCDTRSSLNAFDSAGARLFDGVNRPPAELASDMFGYAVTPALAIGLSLAASLDSSRGQSAKWRARRYGIDVLLMSESLATTLAIMQLAKFTTQRRRPDAIDEPVDGTRIVDQNASFFSGHTALAFSLATSAGTIAALRHERLAPVVFVIGTAAATVTGMLRVAANQHFVTDVLAGALVGSVVGVIVPVLHRVKAPVRIGGSASATAGIDTVSGAFF